MQTSDAFGLREIALRGGAVKEPIEFASQTWFAVSISPFGCETIFHHWRSAGSRPLISTVARVEILVANVHKRNISQPKPVKTSTKRVRALDLTLRRCFDRLAKDIASSLNNSQHS
jgi:hypothetical protein